MAVSMETFLCLLAGDESQGGGGGHPGGRTGGWAGMLFTRKVRYWAAGRRGQRKVFHRLCGWYRVQS